MIGSSIALQILFGLPIWAGALITILDSFVFLFIHYFGIRKLEVRIFDGINFILFLGIFRSIDSYYGKLFLYQLYSGQT